MDKIMSIEEVKRICNGEGEQGFDAPFATFTWEHWLALQAKFVQGFTSYQRAIERQEPLVAHLIVLDLYRLVTELHVEACSWTDERHL